MSYHQHLKLFTDDVNQPTEEMKWAYQCKLSFNPDKSKQNQEVILSCKSTKVTLSLALFDNCPVAHSNWQKYLGLYLAEKLTFKLLKGFGY